ncbi:MAG: hypothetical protein ACI837_002350 [Crocinitomicaceae bacterium]|jgi:hypothetical protein
MIPDYAYENCSVNCLFLQFQFTHDGNCDIIDLIIVKPGHLQSFNKEVGVFCQEVLEELKKTDLQNPFSCSQMDCEDTIWPLRLYSIDDYSFLESGSV